MRPPGPRRPSCWSPCTKGRGWWVTPHDSCLLSCFAPLHHRCTLLRGANPPPAVQPTGYVVANDVDPKRAYMLVAQCRRVSSSNLIGRSFLPLPSICPVALPSPCPWHLDRWLLSSPPFLSWCAVTCHEAQNFPTYQRLQTGETSHEHVVYVTSLCTLCTGLALVAL